MTFFLRCKFLVIIIITIKTESRKIKMQHEVFDKIKRKQNSLEFLKAVYEIRSTVFFLS